MNKSFIQKEKKKCNKSSLIYNNISFYSYIDDKNLIAFSLVKILYLLNFYDENLIKVKSRSWDKIKKKEKVYNSMSELHNKRFESYHNEYNKLPGA